MRGTGQKKHSLGDTGIAFPDHGLGEAYSYDGRLAAIGGNATTIIRVYDLQTRAQVSPDLDLNSITGSDELTMSNLNFNRDDSRLIASLGTGTAVILDTSEWEVVARLEPDDLGGATTAVYTPEGDLVTRGVDGSIVVRDPDSLEALTVIEGGSGSGGGGAYGPYVSADSQYLLTLRDNVPRLWHLPSATFIGSFPSQSGVVNGGAPGAQLRLVTAVDDHALVWNLDPDTWRDIACQAAGRNLTAEEWKQFGPADEAYRATCPQWPANNV